MDNIIGFITRGRGLTVLRIDCARVIESDPERRVELSWGKDAAFNRPVKVKVLCKNEKGLLASMSAKISSVKVNIVSAQINTGETQATCIFEVDVNALPQLKKVMSALERVRGVIKVERISG